MEHDKLDSTQMKQAKIFTNQVPGRHQGKYKFFFLHGNLFHGGPTRQPFIVLAFFLRHN